MPRSAARATNSTSPSRVWAITGPARVLDGLLDQRERVLVVLVDDDDREVGVLGGDQLDRLRDRDGVRRHLVPEARRARRRARPGRHGPRRRSARGGCRWVGHRHARHGRLDRSPGPAPRRYRLRAPASRRARSDVSTWQAWTASKTDPNQQRPASGASISVAEDRADACPGGPAAARPLPPRGRSRRARAARHALPAARAPARAPLPARRRAARRPRPGRLARAAQGDRPLRPGARDRVLVVRRADDPRRAQAPLPRQGLVRARAARPAGARGQGRPGRRRDVARARPRADARRARRAHRHDARAGARGARGVRRLPRRLARPPAHGGRGGRRLLRRRGRRRGSRASASPRTPRPSSG